MQHDALTLSAALQLPFVDLAERRVGFAAIVRTARCPGPTESLRS
jgi:hypothetical protein